MSVLVVSSPEPNAGKTTFVVALSQRLRRLGRVVSYRRLAGEGAAADAAFVGKTLRVAEPAARLVVESGDLAETEGDEVLLVEGADPQSAAAGARLPRAASVVIARYVADGLADKIIEHVRVAGAPGAKVVVNVVPEKGLRQVRQKVLPRLAEAGLASLGELPQERALLGMTVGELAEGLGARVLTAPDQLGLPVEAVMIAAMSDEGAEDYFRRVPRKAVVCGGDRPDIHLPALATDLSCIVLTEGLDPDPTVYKTADEEGVPLLQVKPGTIPTLDAISTALENVRFRQDYKVPIATRLLDTHVDVATLLAALGVAPEPV
jgi:BioD-like phosphotransacetylase family protein